MHPNQSTFDARTTSFDFNEKFDLGEIQALTQNPNAMFAEVQIFSIYTLCLIQNCPYNCEQIMISPLGDILTNFVNFIDDELLHFTTKFKCKLCIK